MAKLPGSFEDSLKTSFQELFAGQRPAVALGQLSAAML
jgi:hypothetical protein